MMGRIRSVVRQLRGRSPHELYSRAAQRAYALSERASLGTAGVDRVPGFDEKTIFSQPFLYGVGRDATEIDECVKALRELAPMHEREVMERAGAAARGDISLFGYGLVSLGESPDWQRDPFAGLRAPQRHWSTIPYLDRSVVGDHKVVWEINRHQYFVTFGQAFAFSQDERWPRAFTRLMDSWLADNPPTVGMNWCSSLEVSYRAISWIWALQMMRCAPALDRAFKARVLASLQAHGRHLERYLSTYFSPNTHLTGEALGLFYIGTQCPELPRARHWADLGATILESEIDRQILPDGVYFEQATQYHRYTIDIYLHYLLLAERLGRKVSQKVRSALEKMFDVLLHITRGNGTYPLIGDDDGGRLMQLDSRTPDDARALLAIGAVVLERDDLAWMGRGDDASLIWMLGASSPGKRDKLVIGAPRELDKAFASGGLYTMRDSWEKDASVAVIDAGPHGALSYGHSHADPLAVDLAIRGQPIFVDAGTYTYVGDERNQFRSTAAHNTIEIDGIGTSIPHTAFRWKSVSNAVATGWSVTPEYVCFRGTHDGYQHREDPVMHERTVVHNRNGLWVVQDVLTSQSSHEAVLRWHCAPGLVPAVILDAESKWGVDLMRDGTSQAALLIVGIGPGRPSIADGWTSAQFGQKSPASVCEWRMTVGNRVVTSIVMDTARYAVLREGSLPINHMPAVALDVLESNGTEMLVVCLGDGNGKVYQILPRPSDSVDGQRIQFTPQPVEGVMSFVRVDRQTGQRLGSMTVPLPPTV